MKDKGLSQRMPNFYLSMKSDMAMGLGPNGEAVGLPGGPGKDWWTSSWRLCF